MLSFGLVYFGYQSTSIIIAVNKEIKNLLVKAEVTRNENFVTSHTFCSLCGNCSVSARAKYHKTSSPENEEYWRCGPYCQEYCNRPDSAFITAKCAIMMCAQACICKNGYIRETSGGACIPTEYCPIITKKPKKKKKHLLFNYNHKKLKDIPSGT